MNSIVSSGLKMKLAVVALMILFSGVIANAGEDAKYVELLDNAKRGISFRGQKEKVERLNFTTTGKRSVVLSIVFNVDNPQQFAGLRLNTPWSIKELTINDKKIPVPIEGLEYQDIPGIPTSMLKKGKNELCAYWDQYVWKDVDKATSKEVIVPSSLSAIDVPLSLIGQYPNDLSFQTKPVLGYAGEDFLTLTCRTNMVASVALEVAGKKYDSKPGLLHSFKVEGLKKNTEYDYKLIASLTAAGKRSEVTFAGKTKTLSGGGKFNFAVSGDSRSFPHVWAKVAASILKHKPEFLVFGGDMVTSGRKDYEWDRQYFTPAAALFSTIPYYPVMGNHEQNTPLFLEIFKTPNGKKNWSQRIGSVLLIGIDGEMSWKKDSKLAKWLEKLLSKSKAKFIFLFTHYPAWSSGAHGREKGGRPVEPGVQKAREVIMPLLKKYNATAMFAGHDHVYERSEPTESGVTQVITGGAGAPLRQKSPKAAEQNPYSKVFASKYHYCQMAIDGDNCTMTVVTPEGEVIDTRAWKARK